MLAGLRKPKTWAWIAGSFVFLAVGIAGLTGVLVRHELAALQTTPLELDNGSRLHVEALQGGWFTTQVTLRMEWPLGNQRELLLRLANDIGHGPFPLDRLAHFDWRPAALTDRLSLLELHDSDHGPLPASFSSDVRLSYLGRLQAQLQADLPALPLGIWQLSASALSVQVDAASDSLDLQLQANQLALLQGGAPLLRLSGVTQQVQLAGDAVLALQASVKELALWDQPVGQLGQQLSAKGISLAAALQALAGEPNAWASALPAGSQVQGKLLSLVNADGSSALQLDKPPGTGPLKVQANLSRPMFMAAIERNSALQQQGQAIAEQQAHKLFAMVSQPLLQTGLFVSDEQGLSMALEIDAGGVRSTLPTRFVSQVP